MKERGILFRGPLVRALLAGDKTQTRRPAKVPMIGANGGALSAIVPSLIAGERARGGFDALYGMDNPRLVRCQYGAPGDRLWVRETMWRGRWTEEHFYNDVNGDSRSTTFWCRPQPGDFESIAYVADGPAPADRCEAWDKVPAIHMPRWASRIDLDVLDIRAERVQDISEADARAEGLVWWARANGVDDGISPLELWRLAWTSIHGDDEWARNPFVWAISFTVTSHIR